MRRTKYVRGHFSVTLGLYYYHKVGDHFVEPQKSSDETIYVAYG
jgi:hypothetical protein